MNRKSSGYTRCQNLRQKTRKTAVEGSKRAFSELFWGVQKITFYARMAPKSTKTISLKKASIKPLKMLFWASSSRKTLVFDPLQKCPKYGIGFKRELEVVTKRTFRVNLRLDLRFGLTCYIRKCDFYVNLRVKGTPMAPRDAIYT